MLVLHSGGVCRTPFSFPGQSTTVAAFQRAIWKWGESNTVGQKPHECFLHQAIKTSVHSSTLCWQCAPHRQSRPISPAVCVVLLVYLTGHSEHASQICRWSFPQELMVSVFLFVCLFVCLFFPDLDREGFFFS